MYDGFGSVLVDLVAGVMGVGDLKTIYKTTRMNNTWNKLVHKYIGHETVYICGDYFARDGGGSEMTDANDQEIF